MALQYQFRPIVAWPGSPTRSRYKAKFRANYSQTLKLLDRELQHLKARQIVVQADVTEGQIRQDGMLYASARPSSPRIILSFNSIHGALSYPCDRYSDWQDNLRAIALSLEALRMVDRYGVTKSAEQYRGFQALPPPKPGFEEVENAASVIRQFSGYQGPFRAILTDRHFGMRMILEAQKHTHPDKGGNVDSFKKVMAALAVLEKHYGTERR